MPWSRRAYAADQLFATLDTTTRQLYLGEAAGSVSLSDTVGFIRDLPHGLVDARPRCRRRLMPICCCTWWMPPTPLSRADNRCSESWAKSAPRTCRSSGFQQAGCIEPGQRPAALQDAMDVAGQPVPRVFRQCPHGRGLGQLREELARRVQAAVQARKTAPEGGAHAIGHNGWMNSREIDECMNFSTPPRPAAGRAASGDVQPERSALGRGDNANADEPARPDDRRASPTRRRSAQQPRAATAPTRAARSGRAVARLQPQAFRPVGRLAAMVAAAVPPAARRGGDFQPDMKNAGKGIGLIAAWPC
jgi:hypothetical protein